MMLNLKIQDTFNQELPADPIMINSRRQVEQACFSYVTPRVPSNPSLVHVSDEMMSEIGLEKRDIASKEFLNMVTGAKIIKDFNPYAMCYGGHQFGHWAGQLGDGRAINLGELVHQDKRWVLQLKGAGATPYSRTADGLAVLRSSIREHLCSEAMYHLGVPTTRSLSLSLSGDEVLRDVMYDGNSAYEKGAIVCRVAPSFVRFGNFQILAQRGDTANLKILVDYTIKHFFKEITQSGKDKYVAFFNDVLSRTLEMIIHWQRVGFVHGVMNTDNMSILGLTIDYGPYGWLEGYDLNWTPNTTDRQNRRYRFGNQPNIGLWNLFQLANALYPLVGESKPFEDALEAYKEKYPIADLVMMKSKLGLSIADHEDASLIAVLKETLALIEIDMTIFFRLLSDVTKSDTIEGAISKVHPAFYDLNKLTSDINAKWKEWMSNYLNRLQKEEQTDTQRKRDMDLVNPKYVLRNYMAQLAIDKADSGDYSLIEVLYQLLKKPYDEQLDSQQWFAKRPDWARNKVGCSMLSCSS